MYAAPGALYKEIDGFTVILNIAIGEYQILNPVATRMWDALLNSRDRAEALRLLESQYSVARERLQADLDVFIERCIGNGFLQAEKPEPRPDCRSRLGPRRRRLLSLRAWWCLLRTSRSLARHGFAATYRRFSDMGVAEGPLDDDDAWLRRNVAAFAFAENLYVLQRAPNDCLPRSLALFWYLRSAGLAVEHCIGVRRLPFAAHAWVEYRGHVVHDSPVRPATYKELARITA